SAIMLAFNLNWSLQTFEHDHGHSSRAAGGKLRPGQRRILARHTEAICLMAGLTICSKNFFAPIARGQFNLLPSAGTACNCFLWRRRRAHWIESAVYEIS